MYSLQTFQNLGDNIYQEFYIKFWGSLVYPCSFSNNFIMVLGIQLVCGKCTYIQSTSCPHTVRASILSTARPRLTRFQLVPMIFAITMFFGSPSYFATNLGIPLGFLQIFS